MMISAAIMAVPLVALELPMSQLAQ